MKFSKAVPSVFALVLSATVEPAAIAAVEEGLRGVAVPRLIIEDLDENANRCGITKDALDAAVRLPMSSASLLARPAKADDLSWSIAQVFGPYIYVNVNVLRLQSGLCVAAVTVEFKRPVNFGSNDTPKVTHVGVWSKAGILTGPPAEFGIRVANMTESYAKQFVSAWLQSN